MSTPNEALQPDARATHRVRLPARLRAELEEWACECYPHEGCGLLLGSQGAKGAWIERATRARNANVERARDRYDLHPEDQLAAELSARALGLDVVGVWHTHPDHPARPSETDRARAWPGWSYVILSVSPAGVEAVASFRLAGDQFVEEELWP